MKSIWCYLLPLLLVFGSKSAPKKELLVFRFKYMYYACGICYTQYQVTAVVKGKGYQHLIGKDMQMTFAHDSLKKYEERHELKCMRCWHYNCTGYLSRNSKKEYCFHTIKIQAYPVDHTGIKKAKLSNGKGRRP